MRKYNVDEITGTIWYEENGVRVSFTADPVISEYQRYLRWLENPNAEVEHLTEIIP
jgi:hypothetical protein